MSPGILAIQGCHDKAGSQLILLTMGIGLDCRLGDFYGEVSPAWDCLKVIVSR
jgi:hypothetical protein